MPSRPTIPIPPHYHRRVHYFLQYYQTIPGQRYRTGNIDLAAGTRTSFLDLKPHYRRNRTEKGVSRLGDDDDMVFNWKKTDQPNLSRLLPFSSRQFSRNRKTNTTTRAHVAVEICATYSALGFHERKVSKSNTC